MPAPSAILDRPEFAILRRLSAAQLRRIKPGTSGRYSDEYVRVDGCLCPLEQAMNLGEAITVSPGLMADIIAGPCNDPASTTSPWWVVCRETGAFTAWNDEHPDDAARKADLAVARAAALAEKKGTDARP